MYPNAEQRQVLARYFGSVRFIYNHYLAERKRQYEENGKSDNYNAQAKELVILKRTEGFEWLKEINSQTLQQTLMHLDTAYKNFFNRTADFPKFKSRKRGGRFTVPQFCYIEDGYVHIPKFKDGLKVKEHRKVKGAVRSMTISVTPTGKYYVSILTEEQYEPMQRTNASVGLDMGLKSLVTTSEGETYDNNRYTKKYEQKLTMAQKHLSRKQKDSNGWEEQRMKVAKIHETLANSRRDWQHKVSADIVRRYDTICVEDLGVKQMEEKKTKAGKKNCLSKSISDAGWSSLIAMIVYKAEMNDKNVVKVDRYYPSSKTCSVCGWRNDVLTLADRSWTCPDCGTKHDRDVNAAVNILGEGLRVLSIKSSAGTVDYTGGGSVRPTSVGNRPRSQKPTNL
ncbi:MAG: transposase [Bacteroidales bacterium]|nr:transposase [Candidatus Cryptobacteroides choladohippi]